MQITQAVQRIDLADRASHDPERRNRFARTLVRGLEETGFVRVIGHGRFLDQRLREIGLIS